MIEIGENISNLKKILSIKEEIALAYSNPAFATATGTLIRKLETEIQINAEIYKKYKEYFHIVNLVKERESQIENEELNMEYEYERKIWIEKILYQLELDIKKHQQEILMQLNEKKNLIDLKLKEVSVIISKIDLYLNLLEEKKLVLENRHDKLISELEKIHFDTPLVVIIEDEKYVHDLNEICLFMSNNFDASVTSQSLIRVFIQDKLNQFFDETKTPEQERINKVNIIAEQARLDSKLIKVMDHIDERNRLSEEIKFIDKEIRYFEKEKLEVVDFKNMLLHVKDEITLDVSQLSLASELDQCTRKINVLESEINMFEFKEELIMSDLSLKIEKLQRSLKVDKLENVEPILSTDIPNSFEPYPKSEVSISVDEDDEFANAFSSMGITENKPDTFSIDKDHEYENENEFSLSGIPDTKQLSSAALIMKKLPPNKNDNKQENVLDKKNEPAKEASILDNNLEIKNDIQSSDHDDRPTNRRKM